MKLFRKYFINLVLLSVISSNLIIFLIIINERIETVSTVNKLKKKIDQSKIIYQLERNALCVRSGISLVYQFITIYDNPERIIMTQVSSGSNVEKKAEVKVKNDGKTNKESQNVKKVSNGKGI